MTADASSGLTISRALEADALIATLVVGLATPVSMREKLADRESHSIDAGAERESVQVALVFLRNLTVLRVDALPAGEVPGVTTWEKVTVPLMPVLKSSRTIVSENTG